MPRGIIWGGIPVVERGRFHGSPEQSSVNRRGTEHGVSQQAVWRREGNLRERSEEMEKRKEWPHVS